MSRGYIGRSGGLKRRPAGSVQWDSEGAASDPGWLDDDTAPVRLYGSADALDRLEGSDVPLHTDSRVTRQAFGSPLTTAGRRSGVAGHVVLQNRSAEDLLALSDGSWTWTYPEHGVGLRKAVSAHSLLTDHPLEAPYAGKHRPVGPLKAAAVQERPPRSKHKSSVSQGATMSSLSAAPRSESGSRSKLEVGTPKPALGSPDGNWVLASQKLLNQGKTTLTHRNAAISQQMLSEKARRSKSEQSSSVVSEPGRHMEGMARVMVNGNKSGSHDRRHVVRSVDDALLVSPSSASSSSPSQARSARAMSPGASKALVARSVGGTHGVRVETSLQEEYQQQQRYLHQQYQQQQQQQYQQQQQQKAMMMQETAGGNLVWVSPRQAAASSRSGQQVYVVKGASRSTSGYVQPPLSPVYLAGKQQSISSSTPNLLRPLSPYSPAPSLVYAEPQLTTVPQTLPRNFTQGGGTSPRAKERVRSPPRSAPPQGPISRTMPRNWGKEHVYRGEVVRVQVADYAKDYQQEQQQPKAKSTKVQQRTAVSATTERLVTGPTSSSSLARARKAYHSDPNIIESLVYVDKSVGTLPPQSRSFQPVSGTASSTTTKSIAAMPGTASVMSVPPSPGAASTLSTLSATSLGNEASSSGSSSSVFPTVVRDAPRTIVLQKGRNGFGFVLRGAKSQLKTMSTLDFVPTSDFPALQYLDRVDKGSMADKAGLRPGDFLLEINGESVVNATHEHTVSLIKHSGDTLAMRVVTVKPLAREAHDQRDIHTDGTRTLPLKKKVGSAPLPPMRNPHTSLAGATGNQARSTIDSLIELEKLDRTLAEYDEVDRHSLGGASDSVLNSMAAAKGVDANNKTASIRARPNKRLSNVQLEEIFERQGNSGADPQQSASNQQRPIVAVPRVYANQAELNAEAAAAVNGGRQVPATPPSGMVQQGKKYNHHITRVDVGDGGGSTANTTPVPQRHLPEPTHYAEPGPASTNVSLSSAPQNERVTYNDEERLYAVPFKLYDSKGKSAAVDNTSRQQIPAYPSDDAPPPPLPSSDRHIPPPPSQAPPNPPAARASSHMGEIVPISTHSQHMYANVSSQIQQQRGVSAAAAAVAAAAAAAAAERDFDSSFRPGTNAHLTKEPVAPPPQVKSSHVEHSRSSSNTSSLSSMSEQCDSRGSQHSADAYRNPAKLGAATTAAVVTADARTTQQAKKTPTQLPEQRSFYEPEPDYEGKLPQASSGVDATSPTVKAVRDVWNARDGTSPSSQAQSASPRPATQASQAKPTSPREKQENSMSAFGNAIKMAAAAREQRGQESPPRETVKSTTATTSPSARSKGPAPPPPPPPPSQASLMAASAIPPPPQGTPPAPPSFTDTPKRAPLPPHVQKQLDDSKKHEETHAALLAAVARRRDMVDNVDMTDIASNIESRVTRGKKLQTIVYKSDQSKTEVQSNAAVKAMPLLPVAATSSPNRKEFKAAPGTDIPLKKKEQEEEEEKKKKELEKARNSNEDKNNNRGGSSGGGSVNGRSGGVHPAGLSVGADNSRRTSAASETDFRAMAEKARQEWLEKRGTLERNKAGGGGPRDAAAPATLPRQSPQQRQSTPPQQSSIGDMAQIIAQRAKQRQANGALGTNNNNNGSDPPGSPIHIVSSPASTTDRSEKTIQITGATMDYSHTDTPRSSRAASFANMDAEDDESMSVADRRRMFEKSKRQQPADDSIPPPMIPPPLDFGFSGSGMPDKSMANHSRDIGGQFERSSGLSQERTAVSSKLAAQSPGRSVSYTNGDVRSNGVSHMVMVADVPDVDTDLDWSVIPPPPVFGTEQYAPHVPEDAVSMASSVSTLSTLSSADHDHSYHDSPRHSSHGFAHSNGSGLLPESDIPIVPPPPPPEFDDSSPKDASAGSEFVPPPFGFDIPAPAAVATRPQTNSVSYPASPRRNSFKDKPIETWSTAEVGEWLDSLNLSQHRDRFARHRVHGQTLIQMGRSELIKLGVDQVGDRMAIERAIKKALVKQ